MPNKKPLYIYRAKVALIMLLFLSLIALTAIGIFLGPTTLVFTIVSLFSIACVLAIGVVSTESSILHNSAFDQSTQFKRRTKWQNRILSNLIHLLVSVLIILTFFVNPLFLPIGLGILALYHVAEKLINTLIFKSRSNKIIKLLSSQYESELKREALFKLKEAFIKLLKGNGLESVSWLLLAGGCGVAFGILSGALPLTLVLGIVVIGLLAGSAIFMLSAVLLSNPNSPQSATQRYGHQYDIGQGVEQKAFLYDLSSSSSAFDYSTTDDLLDVDEIENPVKRKNIDDNPTYYPNRKISSSSANLFGSALDDSIEMTQIPPKPSKQFPPVINNKNIDTDKKNNENQDEKNLSKPNPNTDPDDGSNPDSKPKNGLC